MAAAAAEAWPALQEEASRLSESAAAAAAAAAAASIDPWTMALSWGCKLRMIMTHSFSYDDAVPLQKKTKGVQRIKPRLRMTLADLSMAEAVAKTCCSAATIASQPPRMCTLNGEAECRWPSAAAAAAAHAS